MKTEQLIHWPAPGLTLEVQYKDIGGEYYKEMYDVWIDMNYIFSDADRVQIGGKMVFEKKKRRSSAMKRFERLRGRYAEIQKEEELNYFS